MGYERRTTQGPDNATPLPGTAGRIARAAALEAARDGPPAVVLEPRPGGLLYKIGAVARGVLRPRAPEGGARPRRGRDAAAHASMDAGITGGMSFLVGGPGSRGRGS